MEQPVELCGAETTSVLAPVKSTPVRGTEESRKQVSSGVQTSDEKLVALEDDSELLSLPFLTKDTCQYLVPRRNLLQRVHREFSSYEESHGAISRKVLLWGCSGNGKRQFATSFAKEFAEQNGRLLIWVQGYYSATFIRDMCLAYQVVVGSPVPRGVTLTFLLCHIKQVLSQANQKWFMVIFDLNPRLTNPNLNEAGLALTAYLPEGQILITHSSRSLFGGWDRETSAICRSLELEGLGASVHIYSMNRENASAYIQKAWPAISSSGLQSSKTVHSLKTHLLTLVMATATSRLLGIPLARYQKLLDQKMAESQQQPCNALFAKNLLLRFACSMELLMEVLTATNQNAQLLLTAIVLVAQSDVSLTMLEKLPYFQAHGNELEDSLLLLQSISIIEVRKLSNGERYIDMNRWVYTWLDMRMREDFIEGNNHCKELLEQWIELLDCSLPEVKDDPNRMAYWRVVQVCLSIFDVSRAMDIQTLHLMSLLRKVGMFLSECLICPVATNQILARALNLCCLLTADTPGLDLNMPCVQLHAKRSRLLALMGAPAQARTEMRAAKAYLELVPDSDTKVALHDSLFDETVSQLLREDRTTDANRMAMEAFGSYRENLTPKRTAQLHYLLACSSNLSELTVFALQNSHMAMAYWNTLPERTRWGSESFHIVAWPDTHAGILMQMDKSRGALVFLPRILHENIRLSEPTHENIWRLAFCSVREQLYLHEFEEAEKVALQVLSLCDPRALPGTSSTWACLMLNLLGSAFRRVGRFVEAEGVLRFVLECIAEKQPPSVTNPNSPHTSPQTWVELVHVLLVQGKVEEAKAARSLSLEKGFDNLRDDDWMEVRQPYDEMVADYERALQAVRDRNNGLYNPDDSMLDIHRSKSFSLVIKMFGDPFQRIEDGNDDLRHDIYPSRCNDAGALNSKVLDLLGFDYDEPISGRFEEPHVKEKSTWAQVFGADLTAVNVKRQSRIWNYWRWCDCRRKLNRSSSIDYAVRLDRRRTRETEAAESARAEVSPRRLRQTKIKTFFVQRPTYASQICRPDCPCIEANKRGKVLTEEIEAEKLFVYQSPDESAREAKHLLYLESLALYRRYYGLRPAFPYGMNYYETWKRPRGSSEGEGSRQHELFWTPDFVIRGDAASRTDIFTDENYLLSSPAMQYTDQVGSVPVIDLPNIVVTSYKLGEPVRGNVDKWTRSSTVWLQPPITFYLKRKPSKTRQDSGGSGIPAVSLDLKPKSGQSSPARGNSRSVSPTRSTRDSIYHCTSSKELESLKNPNRYSSSSDTSIESPCSSRSRSRSPSHSPSHSQGGATSPHSAQSGSNTPTRSHDALDSRTLQRRLKRFKNRGKRKYNRGAKNHPFHVPFIYLPGDMSSVSVTESDVSADRKILDDLDSNAIHVQLEDKLRIFSINSIHSGGSIFGTSKFNEKRLRNNINSISEITALNLDTVVRPDNEGSSTGVGEKQGKKAQLRTQRSSVKAERRLSRKDRAERQSHKTNQDDEASEHDANEQYPFTDDAEADSHASLDVFPEDHDPQVADSPSLYGRREYHPHRLEQIDEEDEEDEEDVDYLKADPTKQDLLIRSSTEEEKRVTSDQTPTPASLVATHDNNDLTEEQNKPRIQRNAHKNFPAFKIPTHANIRPEINKDTNDERNNMKHYDHLESHTSKGKEKEKANDSDNDT